MKNASQFVFRALSILSLEQILKLTKVLRLKQGQLKKAAGEELISWDDTPTQKSESEAEAGGKVLPMTSRKSGLPSIEMPATDEEIKKKKDEEESSTLLTSDIILWQREITRDTG